MQQFKWDLIPASGIAIVQAQNHPIFFIIISKGISWINYHFLYVDVNRMLFQREVHAVQLYAQHLEEQV